MTVTAIAGTTRAFCFMAVSALGLSGCTFGPKPIAELGIKAYEGNHIAVSEGIPLIGLGGGEANEVDTRIEKAMTENFERLKIYVDPAIIDSGARENVIYDQARLGKELTSIAQDSAVKYGRFVRVTSRSQADIVAVVRLSTLVPWGDWSKTVEQLQSTYKGAATDKLQDISREGLDVLVTLSYFLPAGEQIAASNAVGRIVSRRGEVFLNARSDRGHGGSGTQVQNAHVDETRLPQVLSQAVDGAFVASFKQVDNQLWMSAGSDSVRHKRTAMNDRRTDQGLASAPIPPTVGK